MQHPRDILAAQFYDIPKFYSQEEWGFKYSEQEMKMFASQWKIHCAENAGSSALCTKYVFFLSTPLILGYVISIISSNQVIIVIIIIVGS